VPLLSGGWARMTLERAELRVSDYSQIGPLTDYLQLMAPGAGVRRSAGSPGPGEQGALDVLMLLADSSVLLAAVRVLPEFLRSRKTGLSITMTVKGEPLTLTATNIDAVMPILDRLLQ